MPNDKAENQTNGMPVAAKVILFLGILIAGLGFVYFLSDVWKELFEKKSFFVACSLIFYAAGGFLHYKNTRKVLREIFYLIAGMFTVAGFWLFFPELKYMPEEFKAFYALVFIFALGFLLDSLSHYLLSCAIFLYAYFYAADYAHNIQSVFCVASFFAMNLVFLGAFLWRRRVSLLLLFLIALFSNSFYLSPYLPVKLVYLPVTVLTFWAIAAFPSVRADRSGLGKAAMLLAVIVTSCVYALLLNDDFWHDGFRFFDPDEVYASNVKNVISCVFFGAETLFVLVAYAMFFLDRPEKRDLFFYSSGILFALLPFVFYPFCFLHVSYRLEGRMEPVHEIWNNCGKVAKFFFNAFLAAMAYFIFISFRLKSLSMKIFVIPFAAIVGVLFITFTYWGRHTPDGLELIYVGLVIIYSVACYFICSKLERREKALLAETENAGADSE